MQLRGKGEGEGEGVVRDESSSSRGEGRGEGEGVVRDESSSSRGEGRGEGEGEGEGEGKKETCTSKCGIIAPMKNTRNAAVDASAVISGGSVACADAAQNAAVHVSSKVDVCEVSGIGESRK